MAHKGKPFRVSKAGKYARLLIPTPNPPPPPPPPTRVEALKETLGKALGSTRSHLKSKWPWYALGIPSLAAYFGYDAMAGSPEKPVEEGSMMTSALPYLAGGGVGGAAGYLGSDYVPDEWLDKINLSRPAAKALGAGVGALGGIGAAGLADYLLTHGGEEA